MVHDTITPSIAFFTLSVVIRPFSARFAISAALLAPDDRHAMLAFERVLTVPAARRVRKLRRRKPAAMAEVVNISTRREQFSFPV